MPQTFQDAIFIAQQLHIRYLWIDALCVRQDDNDDWAREAATMADVYADAYCVISATLAHSDGEGFLHPNPGRGLPKAIASDERSKPLDTCMQAQEQFRLSDVFDMPTHGRAWCFQELLLARRFVSYEHTSIRYTCGNGVIGGDMRGPQTLWEEEEMRLKINAVFGRKRHVTEEEWMSIVSMFTRRRMTVTTDRLPALSGIAERVNSRASRYLGGPWEADLPWNLLWHTQQIYYPELGHALQKSPSFAWCSVSSQVSQDTTSWSSWQSLVTVSEVCCYPTGPCPYGHVSWGYLRLVGSVYTAELVWMQNDDCGPWYWRMSAIYNLQANRKPDHAWVIEGPDNRDIASDVYLVAQRSVEDIAKLPQLRRSHETSGFFVEQTRRATATLLMLGRSKKQTFKEVLFAGGKEEHFVFLVLVPTERPEGCKFEQVYERLGTYHLDKARNAEKIHKHNVIDREIIVV
ncbi:hypothetical protein LTR17_006735 [Elasticomyces elasticus]|nr:hypothetical protein LTR17_006735 [Elasticomyces elasticus]